MPTHVPPLPLPPPPRHLHPSHSPTHPVEQVRVTTSIQQYLPSFVPGLLGLGAPPPLERLVVDDERHILYALNAASAILVSEACLGLSASAVS